MLGVEGVSVTLAGRQILDDVSFDVGAGEFTGLIGSNGAGKTTLLRVILGLQRPSAGRVLIAGGHAPGRNRVHRLCAAEGAPRSGHAHAGPRPGRPRARRAPFRDAAAVRGRAVLRSTRCWQRSMPSDSPTPGSGTLSGGEQQRILIAHALIGRPQLLLLDEPLANLDLAQRPGDRQLAAPHRRRAADRRAALGPRDEPAAAGHGPGRLSGGWTCGQRDHRRGHPRRRPHDALRASRRRPARARACHRRRFGAG